MKLKEIATNLCICHKTKQDKVLLYKNKMDQGASFPPIEVVYHNGFYYVKDGNHRCSAAHLIDGLIWANVYDSSEFPDFHLIGKRITWKPNL